MRLVIIGHLLPEPASSAAGTRMLELMRLFSSFGYSITYATAAQNVDFSVDLKDYNVAVETIELNSDRFNEQIKQLAPHVVLFDRYLTEEQYGWRVAKECPDAVRIIDTEDLHCLREARRLALKSSREVRSEDYFNDIAKREIAALFRADMSLMISRAEIDVLTSVYNVPSSQLHYLPFLPENVERKSPSFAERNGFMTIGNFIHPPNADSVRYLKKEIWPLIRNEFPTAKMHVYGAYPSESIGQLNDEKTGFFVHGRAESSTATFQSARVCLAPLRFGAGMKGKLLEAMVLNTPSVTTSIGAEGMHGSLNWAGAVTDDPTSFAAEAVALHNNEEAWNQANENGRTILTTVFDSPNHRSQFKERLTALQGGLNNHRNQNFIGQMMQFHTMRSTEFMSRFIAEKNR
ncbi:MAG: glycosyltransferase [Flavobacteriales bacterium]|nr:glycosyltransferase [Flavobacteriales bacterium]MDG1780864.1 glycosyltransferase [Flavobacteriales bacterium]MDG2246711.1 glycosyltransferase [Flavobacteriales bacterium]